MLCGCDVGSSAVKLVVLDPADGHRMRFAHREPLRKRRPAEVVEDCFARAEQAGFPAAGFASIAATGDEGAVLHRSGHFFVMTCQARGARSLFPDAASVLDLGALHLRAIRLDPRGRVADYRMTGQCTSGSGHFLENVARYLGLPLEQMGRLSLESRDPPTLSTVCVVLAETDIVNMVTRGLPLPDILGSIHDAIARRALRLIAGLGASSPLVLTGGLSANPGIVRALGALLATQCPALEVRVHESAHYAGAIGAALWGGWRLNRHP